MTIYRYLSLPTLQYGDELICGDDYVNNAKINTFLSSRTGCVKVKNEQQATNKNQSSRSFTRSVDYLSVAICCCCCCCVGDRVMMPTTSRPTFLP